MPHGDESYFGPTGGPAHPIVEFVVRGNWWGRIQVLLVAAVAAPIVEETMFRGVLYRHLREATARWGRAGSVVVSGLVAAALFAVLHPQGIVAVPALTTLAMSFTLMREWRGTLVPGMVAHGLNNGAVMVWLLLMAG